MRWGLQIWDANLKFQFGFDFDFRDLGFRARAAFFEHGRPIPPEFVPLRFAQLRNKSGYPDLFTGPSAFQMVVSARMRAVLESVAPPWAGLDFTPVVIERPDGQPGPEGYTFFKVLDFVDAIIAERSQVAPKRHEGKVYHYSSSTGARFAFREEAVVGRHVWVDRLLKSRVFISDEMRAAMMEAGLTGVATRPVDPD
jgi:hypothetical protein